MSEDINENPARIGWHSKRVIMRNPPPRPRKIPDYSAKKRKQRYQRMTYAPEGGVFAIDIMVVIPPSSERVYYLLCQNINTRYIYAQPLPDKSKESIIQCLSHFLTALASMNEPVKGFIGDGEKGWANHDVISGLRALGIRVDFIKSNYLHHILILDATIETLRRGCNGDNDFLADFESFSKLIYLFNHSVIKTTQLTPTEMEEYPELEWSWIRHCKRYNDQIQKEYTTNYRRGNILLVHFNQSKTDMKFV
jgi:hypothetical protein